jgi:hypothetical protein
MVGLALVAAFAFAALAGSASAAAPVFYTKAAIGEKGPAVSFTGTLGPAFLEGAGGTKITCTAGTATGEANGATTTANNVTKFTGCETGGVPCENAAAKEIDTKILAGVLGNVVANKTPAVRLFDEKEGPGGKLAEFTCAGGAVAVVVHGSAIGSLSGASGTSPATGKFPASISLVFAESKGIQKYTKFVEGGDALNEQLEASVGGAPFEKSGQSVTAKLTSTPKSNLNSTL